MDLGAMARPMMIALILTGWTYAQVPTSVPTSAPTNEAAVIDATMMVESEAVAQASLNGAFKTYVAGHFALPEQAVAVSATTLGVTTLTFQITFEGFNGAEAAVADILSRNAYESLTIGGNKVPFLWRTAVLSTATYCVIAVVRG